MPPDEVKPIVAFGPTITWLLTALGLLALLFTWGQEFQRVRRSAHDADPLYLSGLAWRHEVIPYGPGRTLPTDPNGPDGSVLAWNYYPPHCGLLMAPISLLPYQTFAWIWPKLQLGMLLISFWVFIRCCFPDWPAALRLFVIGVTGLSSGVRWIMDIDQPSALIIALLLLFAVAVVQRRWAATPILTVLIGMKPTFLLPCLVVLLFCRRADLLLMSLALLATITLLAAAPTGCAATLHAYRHQISDFSRPGSFYDPRVLLSLDVKSHPRSPLAHHPDWQATHRPWNNQFLQIEYAVSAWAPGYAQTQWLGIACKTGLIALFGWLWLRVRRTSLYRDREFLLWTFAASLGLMLLIVYHQIYDALALAPIVLVAMDALLHGSRRLPIRAAFIAGVAFVYLTPYRLVRLWEGRVILRYGLLVLAPICSYMTLIIFAFSFISLVCYTKSRLELHKASEASTSLI